MEDDPCETGFLGQLPILLARFILFLFCLVFVVVIEIIHRIFLVAGFVKRMANKAGLSKPSQGFGTT